MRHDDQAVTGASSGAAQNRMLIDGKLVTSDRTYPSINPATGEVLGQAPDATIEVAS
jgi:aldehyde dehydrogenase (NAD+)